LAVRVALGATSIRLMTLIFVQACRLMIAGLTTGLVVMPAVAPLLRNIPVGVRSPDFPIVASAAMVIGIVVMAACYVPARRATSADPIVALRCE
jgi:ABC-type antimicrobial peptide transport system permease subunit